MSVDAPENAEFIKNWKTFIKNDKRVTNDPMEAHFIGFNMWVEGGREGGHHRSPTRSSTPSSASSVPNLSGGSSTMMPNHHITKPVLIGEIQDDGQFHIVWQTSGLVRRRRVVRLPRRSKDLISDWRKPLACGNFNAKTGKCGGGRS